MVALLITAGGKIICTRCTALSIRSGMQCRRPALKSSKSKKCQFHGGGPLSGKQSVAGRRRISQAKYKHGESSKGARAQYSKASAFLRQLEDAMYVLGMTTAPRTRGRKPNGYSPVRSIQDIKELILDNQKH
jgi:hypothetical protein